MYQTFKDMVHQLFSDLDFTEYCYINGIQYNCIVSKLNNNIMYTEAGVQSEENFTLDLEIAALHQLPKEGDKIIFREKVYKIASTEEDSANASIKLYLIALSKGA